MSHATQAIAWTLIHFCWQAAVIAAVYGVAARITAYRSSHVRYAVALSALLAMLVAAVLTFAWQIAPRGETQSTGTALVSMGDFPRSVAPGRAPAAITFAAGQEMVERMPPYLLWIDAAWLLGVCGLAFRNVGGLWMIRRLRTRAARNQAPADVQERFTRLVGALGLKREVLLRVSDAIAGPVTVGAVKTVVLLPMSAVTGLGPEELEVVLAHELAHVRRADFMWNLLQTVVETLFFFHPVVWWISGRVRQERELCCDDLALDVCPNPVVYASALFHLEEQRSRQLHLAMALDGNQGRQTLRRRIARILGDQSAIARPGERRFSLAAVLAGALVLLVSAPQVIASLSPHMAPAVATLGRAVEDVAKAPASAAASVMASPVAAVAQTANGSSKPAPERRPAASDENTDEASAPASAQTGSGTGSHGTYIDGMKAAGYDVDLDKLIAMKIQNVTPEYARAMSQVGLGKPSADDLLACKIQGVSPERIAELKRQGLEVKSFQDAVSYQIFNLTPEFVAGMKAAGFTDMDSKKLLAMRVQGVTPEYAKSVLQQFPGITADELVQSKIFNVDGAFIASAKAHGFKDLTMKKLVQIRISGILDDEK
ncbi:MAG TPA: M56 family metallopeptidase [Terracidiphilus sp.]|jgi:beta-lactamase regulating signal transducer with metallopeptidase domain